MSNDLYKIVLRSKYKNANDKIRTFSLEEKKEYIEKMFDNYSKKGILTKFNNAIGYKELIPEFFDNGRIQSEIVKSPIDYKTPYSLLFSSMRVTFEEDEVVTFIVEQKFYKHPISKYSYLTLDLCYKFMHFLNKIFPDLETIIESVEDFKPSEYDDIVNKFYLFINKDFNYDIYTNSSRLLSYKEQQNMLDILRPLSKNQLKIIQHECDTCKEKSNNQKPYHIELDYITI